MNAFERIRAGNSLQNRCFLFRFNTHTHLIFDLQLQTVMSSSLPYLTLPSGWVPAQGRHPALRPQHGPNAQPRQTSRSIELLRSFGKLQEQKPMDIPQRVQRKSVVSENVLSQKHQSTAMRYEVECCILSLLTEGTARVLAQTHNVEMVIKVRVMSSSRSV